MNNEWPEREATKKGFNSKCTCTPLATDPDCVVHACVPEGEDPLTLKGVIEDQTLFLESKVAQRAAIFLLLILAITIILIFIFLLGGVAIRAFFWMIGA